MSQAQLDAARAKLAEITEEQGLSPDAIALFNNVIDLAAATDVATTQALNLIGEVEGGVSGKLADFAKQLADLAAQPAKAITAEGIDVAPLDDVRARLAAAREKQSIPGETALMFEGILAAFGTQQAPPPPLTEAEQQAPAEPEQSAPAADTAGQDTAGQDAPAPEPQPAAGDTTTEATTETAAPETTPETTPENTPANAGETTGETTTADTTEQPAGGQG